MPSHRNQLILLPPNRVWRTYPGGRTLDQLAGAPTPADTHLAEDWIASTTRAINPPEASSATLNPQFSTLNSSPTSPGISQVRVGLDPTPRDFAELLASDPEYFLGAAHVKKYGAQPQLLVKFLDSGTRLHFQVHPTREFAQRVLGAPSGKTEAYYVLDTRSGVAQASPPAFPTIAGGTPALLRRAASPTLPSSPTLDSRPPAKSSPLASSHPPPATRDAPPAPPQAEPTGYIYVGFQRPPTPAQLRTAILVQDIATIEGWFDPIPVRPGDTFIIPGGTPHALGAGVFMVEIQEPSDLVVRFEFERAGYVLPESARFMNRDVDFALTVFNLQPLSTTDLESRIRCHPHRIRELGPGSWQEALIGPAQTPCFRVTRTCLRGTVVKDETCAVIAIVTRGGVIAEVGGHAHRLDIYEKFFVPAGLGPLKLRPIGDSAEILECYPPV